MSRCRRSTPTPRLAEPVPSGGFTSVELLVGLLMMGLALALTASVMLAGKGKMQEHHKLVETEIGARSVVNAILRELRLSGACLPVNGDFIALEAVDSGTTDEITTRTGLTASGSVTCIRAASAALAASGSSVLTVDDASAFAQGMHVYIRGASGTGEYAYIASVDPSTDQISLDIALSQDYAAASGVYAVEERRFFIQNQPDGTPELMLQINDSAPVSYASGVESLELTYELADGAIVDLPPNAAAWRSLRMINVSSTSRSLKENESSDHYRRSFSLGIKPRNILS